MSMRSILPPSHDSLFLNQGTLATQVVRVA